jgi:hypothetical protein
MFFLYIVKCNKLTPILIAVSSNKEDLVRELFSRYPDAVSTGDEDVSSYKLNDNDGICCDVGAVIGCGEWNTVDKVTSNISFWVENGFMREDDPE